MNDAANNLLAKSRTLAFVGRCECKQCVPMPSGRESICCLEVPNTDPKISNHNNCITEVDEFKTVCTNPAVIETAKVIYVHDHGPMLDDTPNEYALLFVLFRFP